MKMDSGSRELAAILICFGIMVLLAVYWFAPMMADIDQRIEENNKLIANIQAFQDRLEPFTLDHTLTRVEIFMRVKEGE